MAWCHHCQRDVGVMVVLVGKGDGARNALAGGMAKQCNRCQRPIDSEPLIAPPAGAAAAAPAPAKVIPIAAGRASASAAPASDSAPPLSPDDIEGSIRRRLAWLEAEIDKCASYKAEAKRLKKMLSVAASSAGKAPTP